MSSLNVCAWRTWLALLFCSSLTPAAAAERKVLGLDDAIELTVARNADLAAFRPATESRRSEAELNAMSPPTSIELQLENFAGTGAASSTEVLETTLQLSRVVELGGKAELRRLLGDRQLEQLDAAQRAKRADVLAEVARRFVHVLADQEQLVATGRATRLAEQARSVVQERIKAGAASPVFLSRAEIAVARAKIEQEHAEHELASSRVALAVLWGDAHPQFDSVRGDLFSFPVLEPFEVYVDRLSANPDLLKFATESRQLDAQLRLAEAQRRPNITLSAGVRRLEALDAQALVAGFAVPLGSARRARTEISSLHAQRAQLQLAERSRQLDLHSTLFGLYQEILHARTEADALRDDIQPQAQRMVQVTDEGYRAGRFSLLELADAQKQLLEVERDAIRAAAQFHSFLIEIERVTGVAVHPLAERK